MAKAHYLSNSEGKFYPYGHVDATYNDDGTLLGTRLSGIESSLPTDEEMEAWDAKYDLPEDGIPAEDLNVPVIYSGTTEPASTLGKNGDVYFVIPS